VKDITLDKGKVLVPLSFNESLQKRMVSLLQSPSNKMVFLPFGQVIYNARVEPIPPGLPSIIIEFELVNKKADVLVGELMVNVLTLLAGLIVNNRVLEVPILLISIGYVSKLLL
jgi:hypothetical protein